MSEVFKIAQIVAKYLDFSSKKNCHQWILKNRPIWSHWLPTNEWFSDKFLFDKGIVLCARFLFEERTNRPVTALHASPTLHTRHCAKF